MQINTSVASMLAWPVMAAIRVGCAIKNSHKTRRAYDHVQAVTNQVSLMLRRQDIGAFEKLTKSPLKSYFTVLIVNLSFGNRR